MSLRDRIALASRALAGKPVATPPEGEAMSYGIGIVSSQFGDTEARIGSYRPNDVSLHTMHKMRRHYQVAAGADLVALPLMAAEFSLEGDPRIAAYVHACTDRIWADILRGCANGVLTGCQPFEVVWERATTHINDDANSIDEDMDGWRIANVKDIDPENISAILVDGLSEFQGYKAIVPNVDVEAERTFHFAADVRYGNWWGQGRLTRAYNAWYRNEIIADQMLRYLDKLATPPAKVFFIPGKTEGASHREAADAIGAGFTGDETHFSLPLHEITKPDGTKGYEKAWDVELLVDDQRGAMYLAALEHYNKAILRALLVPDTYFSQQGSSGARAMSETHFDVMMLGEEGILRNIIAAYNAQIVPRLVRYTFGPDAPIPTLVTIGLTDSTRDFFAELFKSAVTTGGVAIEWDKIADRLGVPTGQAADAAPAAGAAAAMAEIARLAETARNVRLTLAAGGR